RTSRSRSAPASATSRPSVRRSPPCCSLARARNPNETVSPGTCIRRSTMARQRRKYTNEFKVEAVKLITEQGYSVAEAARSLDVGETLLRSWKQTCQSQGQQAF